MLYKTAAHKTAAHSTATGAIRIPVRASLVSKDQAQTNEPVVTLKNWSYTHNITNTRDQDSRDPAACEVMDIECDQDMHITLCCNASVEHSRPPSPNCSYMSSHVCPLFGAKYTFKQSGSAPKASGERR